MSFCFKVFFLSFLFHFLLLFLSLILFLCLVYVVLCLFSLILCLSVVYEHASLLELGFFVYALLSVSGFQVRVLEQVLRMHVMSMRTQVKSCVRRHQPGNLNPYSLCYFLGLFHMLFPFLRSVHMFIHARTFASYTFLLSHARLEFSFILIPCHSFTCPFIKCHRCCVAER